LAHNIISRCWWYGSRGWIFLLIFCTFSCHATTRSRGAVQQNGVWHGSVYKVDECHWIPSCGKNVPIDIHRCLLNIYGDQTVAVSTVTVATVMWETGHVSGGPTQLLARKMKSSSVSSSTGVHYASSCSSLEKSIASGGDYVEQ
jgi:hypothetical protein